MILTTMAGLAETRHGLAAPVALVPTMGFLHAGHLALVAAARARCASVVVSLFVNPTQFDREDDLARYPRDLARDRALLESAGVDLLFAPTVEEIYPPGFSTTVRVAGVSDGLEGAKRPGHFDGVATVVTKLFNLVRPDLAFFGEKDAQQLAVVRRIVSDLNLPLQIVGVPTVREADGLALSSRNVFLEGEARHHAVALSRALFAAQAAWEGGEREAARLLEAALSILEGAAGVQLEYLALTDPETMVPLQGRVTRGVMSLAAWVGGVRLIDNVRLGDS